MHDGPFCFPFKKKHSRRRRGADKTQSGVSDSLCLRLQAVLSSKIAHDCFVQVVRLHIAG
jgi:hypothetical protein